MGLKVKLGMAALLFVLVFVSPVRAASATVGDISKELICQCGCAMVLANCSHAECASREAMIALIEQNLAQGRTEEQIIQLFIAQYGEQVLAAPPKRGFNLTAWVSPFVAILGGGGLVYIALRNWVRRGQRSQTDTMAEEGDEEYQRRLKKELEEFTERGFR